MNIRTQIIIKEPFAGMWILGFKSIKPAEINVLQYVNIVKSYLINIKNYMNTFENRQYINYIISLRKTMELPQKDKDGCREKDNDGRAKKCIKCAIVLYVLI